MYISRSATVIGIAALSVASLLGTANAAESPYRLDTVSDESTTTSSVATPASSKPSLDKAIKISLPIINPGPALSFVEGDCPKHHPYLVVDDFLNSVTYDAKGNGRLDQVGEMLIAQSNSNIEGKRRGGAWGFVGPMHTPVTIYCVEHVEDSNQ